MECMQCQHDNAPGAQFCSSCGAELVRRCPRCGVDTAAEARFCAACGQKLSHEADGSTSTLPGNEGERRRATVMFCDLTGYTAMGERLDPEEVEEIVARIKMRAVEIVERHGGTVSQFQGDGLLVLFGIPVAHDDDPVRAVRAARALHTLVRAISPEVENRVGQPLRFHSGISSGLIVTSVRDTRDGAIGVTGDTVNLAARLAAKASPDEVLVSPETQRQIEDFFDTSSLEPMMLKGKSEPVVPYRIERETANQSRFEAAERRGLTRFTGREQELHVLQDALGKAINGDGSVITIEGDPGMGKSRLAFEFRHGIDRSEVTVLEGRCQSHGSATPYRPFIDAIRRGLQLRDHEAAQGLHQRAIAAIRSFGGEMEDALPQLLHLLSITSETYPLPAKLEGAELRESLELSILKLLEATTRRRPTVLMLEDWHWADESSESALRRLIDQLQGMRLLVLVLFRPESTFQVANVEHHTAIVLQPLSVAETNSILRSVLSTRSTPAGFAELIHERTAGNPFFAEEIAVALRDQGHIVVERNGVQVQAPLETLDLPETVQATIRARVDRLSGTQRHVLKIAAVLGREFSTKVLAKLLDFGPSLADVLATLSEHDLVQAVRMLPEPEYMFKHVLIQNVVYETLLRQQRKTLHFMAGASIESLYADRLDEHYEALAFHFSHSAESGKAIHYLIMAGDKAAAMFSLANARLNYEKAIAFLDAEEQTRDRLCSRVDITLKLAKASHYAASDDTLKTLETALAFARELDDAHRLVSVTSLMGGIYRMLGEHKKVFAVLEECARHAQALGDESVLASAYHVMGRACYLTGDYKLGIDYMAKGNAISERSDDLPEVSYSCGFSADCYAWLGDFENAFPLVDRSMQLAVESGDISRQAGSNWYLAAVCCMNGDWERGLQAATQCAEFARRIGGPYLIGAGISAEGWARFGLGETEKGIALMQEGLRMMEGSGSRQGTGLYASWIADTCAIVGRTEEAIEYANKALDFLVEFGEGNGEAPSHRALAIVAADRDDRDKVNEHIAQSVQAAEQRGELPQLAITRFRHAEILNKEGTSGEARNQLDSAIQLFKKLKMQWWAEKAGRLQSEWAANR